MNIKTGLELEKQNILKKRTLAEEQLKRCPPGMIRFNKNGNGTKWRQVFGDRPSRIIPKKEAKTAELLARKKFLSDTIKICNDQIQLIEAFLNQYPDSLAYPGNLTDDNQDYRALLAPFFKAPEEVEAWVNKEFESNPEFPESLIVPTKCGIMVRSKSESIIADALYERGIPFRYEQQLLIGEFKFYPDFTILDPRDPRRVIYWEHLGRMDDPRYINRTRFKLSNYLEARLIPGINLILTSETHKVPLDINYVSLLVSHFFE